MAWCTPEGYATKPYSVLPHLRPATRMVNNQIVLTRAGYLEDIDLSTGWPRALPRNGPKRWPSGASVRHMFEIKYDDGFIEGLFRANPVAVSPAGPRLDDILRIREHEKFVPSG